MLMLGVFLWQDGLGCWIGGSVFLKTEVWDEG